MKKSTKLLMTTLLISLGLAACGGNSTSTTANNQQSLTITTFGELATLDSADYDDVPSSDMLGQIFEGLYRVAKDNKVELGMAAEEPTVSADGLVYTFKLRDAKWSDGTPVTAGDFVYTYRKLVNPKEGHVAQSADVFKNAKKIRTGELGVEELGVKAIDDKTLEITLENPAPYLPKL
ncbi:MAG: peptide ABC transporter substrate-binding protein, partial [Granulicatella sp.]